MREEGKKSMQNLGSPNIMVWYGVSIGIRDSWYYIQMNYSHAVWSALTSAVVSVFYQNFYHFQWTKLLIPQWSDYLILNGSFYPPHCTSWICLQPKTHVLLIEFKVEKEPARVWITSGKKKKKGSLQWGQFCDSYNPLSQIPHSLKKKVQGFHLPQTPQSSALPNLITQTLLNCKLQHVHSFL